ncbi:hypothetical protein QJU89_00160 [Pasteurella skyensis]|uniref:Intracellular growth attenuator protein IgaA n=1 Tax=Phocoenobacter skyensis TaxID=97481 RepID=A0AAJ6N892_9PAST|nr:hypothetical protein [Pasteurella skyensis]MDP8161862.1 hypothetical protein [Pasteurella skyensis]MDP8172018.1 hypothetical protein [Pasteurella skyensis]MDP8176253.1 hypothetical protein [Pasteurella skyensis]MDP8178273.1 hypothetical protein [Pasteurella skyensis]MDP8182119.1 hypothetical protein [Pasteurella skyensis]
MYEIQIVIAIILCFIILAGLFRYLAGNLKSRNRLKNLSNPIRTLSEQEKKYLAPHLNINNLSLVSDNVYQLDNTRIIFSILKLQGTSQVTLRVDGLTVIFPYPLEDVLEDENTIEFVVTKVGFSLSAMAISVNEESFLEPNMTLWDSHPEARVQGTRSESKTEYRYRHSEAFYGWGASYFLLALIFCFVATFMEDPLWFTLFMSLSGIATLLMLFKVILQKIKLSSVREVKRIRGKFIALPARSLANAGIFIFGFFVGINYPITIIKEKLAAKKDDESDELSEMFGETVEAEVIFNEQKKRYTAVTLADKVSIDEIYQDHTPRPKVRLVLYSVIAIIFAIALNIHTPSLSENIAYVDHHFLKLNHKTFMQPDELLKSPIQMGDIIQFKDVDNLDVELEKVGKYRTDRVNDDVIRLLATERLQLPKIPEVLTTLAQGSFFKTDQQRHFLRSIYLSWREPAFNDIEKQKKNMEEDRAILFNYAGSPLVVKILNANELVALLDKACQESVISCDRLYQELTEIYATPQNLFFAGLYQQYKDKKLPVEEFRKQLQNKRFLIMKESAARLISRVRNWAESNISNKQRVDNIENLHKNRGGVIIQKVDILDKIVPHNFYNSVFENIQKAQSAKGTISGVVSSVSSTAKGTLKINLIEPNETQSRISLAVLFGDILILLVFLMVLISYIFPVRYPKSKQTSGQLVS